MEQSVNQETVDAIKIMVLGQMEKTYRRRRIHCIHKPKTTIMYEYEIMVALKAHEQIEMIKGMSESGWRLLSVIYDNIQYILYFERPKQQ